jgi:hypothetical protein
MKDFPNCQFLSHPLHNKFFSFLSDFVELGLQAAGRNCLLTWQTFGFEKRRRKEAKLRMTTFSHCSACYAFTL